MKEGQKGEGVKETNCWNEEEKETQRKTTFLTNQSQNIKQLESYSCFFELVPGA